MSESYIRSVSTVQSVDSAKTYGKQVNNETLYTNTDGFLFFVYINCFLINAHLDSQGRSGQTHTSLQSSWILESVEQPKSCEDISRNIQSKNGIIIWNMSNFTEINVVFFFSWECPLILCFLEEDLKTL